MLLFHQIFNIQIGIFYLNCILSCFLNMALNLVGNTAYYKPKTSENVLNFLINHLYLYDYTCYSYRNEQNFCTIVTCFNCKLFQALKVNSDIIFLFQFAVGPIITLDQTLAEKCGQIFFLYSRSSSCISLDISKSV